MRFIKDARLLKDLFNWLEKVGEDDEEFNDQVVEAYGAIAKNIASDMDDLSAIIYIEQGIDLAVEAGERPIHEIEFNDMYYYFIGEDFEVRDNIINYLFPYTDSFEELEEDQKEFIQNAKTVEDLDDVLVIPSLKGVYSEKMKELMGVEEPEAEEEDLREKFRDLAKEE
jgi:hypothetical protein